MSKLSTAHQRKHISVPSNHLLWLLIAVVTCFLCYSGTVVAANYYVDVNSGNDSTGTGDIDFPWATITYAMSTSSAVSAGDTVYVRAGTYREEVVIQVDGTSGSRITLQAYTDETVTLDGSVLLTGSWTQSTSSEADLTVLGVTNSNYANIYHITVSDSLLPADPFGLTTEPMIFRGDDRLRMCKTPTQDSAWGIDKDDYTALESEAWGHSDGSANSPDPDCTPAAPPDTCGVYTYIIDSDELTQADDYWNGAYVDFNSAAANNFIVRRKIADFTQSDTKIIFDTILNRKIWYGTNPDCYVTVNHPHGIDAVDEYYLIDNGDGTHELYLYSTTTPSNISIFDLGTGISGAGYGYGDYVTVQDLTVRNYGSKAIYFQGDSSPHIEGVIIKDCIVKNTSSHGIHLVYADNSIIDGCNVSYTGTEGRGVLVNGGTDNVIKNCTIENTDSSNISAYGQTDGMILYNNFSGAIGGHGNGVACYLSCVNMLVASNKFYECNLALQNIDGAIVYNNYFNMHEDSNYIITTWAGTTEGDFLYFHNTILGSSINASLTIAESLDGESYVINNILDGVLGPLVPDVTEYNLYTGLSWQQGAGYGWSLGTGDVIGENVDLIFTDFDNDDGSLIAGPAVNAGTDVSSYLTQARIDFPGYDFDLDLAGNSRSVGVTDMGAYEYTGPYFDPPIGNKSVEEETSLSFSLSAIDPDGDPITYDYVELPSGAELDGQNFTWTPDSSQVGTYYVTFTVAAGEQVASETITINVTGERALMILSTSGGSVAVPGEGVLIYEYGTELPIQATAEGGYHFINWTGTAVAAGKVVDPSAANTTVTVDADYTLIANFATESPLAYRRVLTVTAMPHVDFDGSGTTDLFWHRTSTGENFAVPMSPSAIPQSYNYIGGGGDFDIEIIELAGDFDNSGTTDILWCRQSSGAYFITPIDNAIPDAFQYIGGGGDPDIWIFGVGDFDGNGTSDLLWTRDSNSAFFLTLMNESAVPGPYRYIGGGGDPDIDIVGLGDFDGSGTTDILWRRTSNSAAFLTLMDDNAIPGPFQYVDWGGDPDVLILGFGDFNDDGASDILTRRVSDGSTWLKMMGDGPQNSNIYLGGGGDKDLEIIAIGDFDDDGRKDLLWNRTSTGEHFVALMGDWELGPYQYVGGGGDLDIGIIGIGDFDGKGTTDLLWQRVSTGEHFVVPIYNAIPGSYQYVGGAGDTDMFIVNLDSEALWPDDDSSV